MQQGGYHAAGESISHHLHRYSALQRTERCRANGDTGMMVTDWATAGVRSCRDDTDRLSNGRCMEIEGTQRWTE